MRVRVLKGNSGNDDLVNLVAIESDWLVASVLAYVRGGGAGIYGAMGEHGECRGVITLSESAVYVEGSAAGVVVVRGGEE